MRMITALLCFALTGCAAADRQRDEQGRADDIRMLYEHCYQTSGLEKVTQNTGPEMEEFKTCMSKLGFVVRVTNDPN